jgi:septal ring factor EnvC (AmiA/AmiB activator)
MKNKLLIIAIFVTITCFISFGCGISQEQYDTAMDDLIRIQQKLESTQDELEAAQVTISDLTNDLNKAEADLESIQDKNSELTTDLNEIQTELETTINTKEELTEGLEKIQGEYASYKSEAQQLFLLLDSALELNNEIIGLNAGIILDDNNVVYQQCRAITDTLLELRDIERDEFQAIWDEAFIDTPSSWTLYHVSFVQLLALHAERIRDKVSWLSLHLNQ